MIMMMIMMTVMMIMIMITMNNDGDDDNDEDGFEIWKWPQRPLNGWVSRNLKMAKNGIHTVFGLYLLSFQSVFVYFGRREMNGSDLLISKVTWESEIACVYQKLWSFGDETKIPICSSWLTGCCVWDGHVRRRDSWSELAQAGVPKCPIFTHFQTIITLDPDLRS